MPLEIETPDGIAEFPDEMQPEEIEAVLRRHYPASSPESPASFAPPSESLMPSLIGGQPQFLSTAPSIPSTPREAALASRERRGPEFSELPAGYVGQEIPDPSRQFPPSGMERLIADLSTAPIGLGAFSKQEGRTIAPGSVESPESPSPSGMRPTRIGTPTSAFIAALPEGKAKDLSAGAYNAAANVFNFFLSPAGVASLGIGSLPAIPQRALAAKFAYDMANGAPEQLGAGDEAMKRGDVQAATEHWLGGAASLGFAGLAAGHAMRPVKLPAMERRSPPIIQEVITEPGAPRPARAALPEIVAEEIKPPAQIAEAAPTTKPTQIDTKLVDALGEREPGAVTAKELSELPASEAAELFDRQRAKGNANQNDGVLAGMKLTPEDVPELIRLREAAQKEWMESFQAGDEVGGKGNFGKITWLNGAIEGAKREGPNYKAVTESKAAAPPSEKALIEDQLVPAVQYRGRTYVGEVGETHATMINRLFAKDPEAKVELQNVTPASEQMRGFALKGTEEFIERTRAAEMVGMKDGKPLYSEWLNELRKRQSSGNAPKETAPVAGVPATVSGGQAPVPVAETKPAAPTATPTPATTIAETKRKPTIGQLRDEILNAPTLEALESLAGRADATALLARAKPKDAQWLREAMDIRSKELAKSQPVTPAVSGEPGFGQGPGAKTSRPSAKPEPPESVEGTGLKHAIDELEREVLGFGERPQQERQGMAAAFQRAGETLAKDSLAGQRLADNLIANPRRGLAGDESALLLRHKVDAFNALNKAAEKTFTGTPEARAEASVEYEVLSAKFRLLLDAINERGSEAGRELRWRQAIAYEDFTFATQERLLRAAKGGEPLTDGERTKLQAEIEAHKAKIADLEKELVAAKVKDADVEVADTVKAVRAQSKKDKAAGKVRDLGAEQNDVVQHLKESFLENDADLSGEGVSIRKLMELLVEREGITERLKMEDRVHEILKTDVDPTITREQAMDLMSGYGKSRLPNPAFAKRVVRDINAQIISVRKLLDYFKGNRPKLTGQLRDAPSQIQRDWLKMVNEAKKAFKLEDTTDNAKLVKSAVDAINTRLSNRIKDLKSEIVTRRKFIRERAPSPYNAETLALRKELEEAQQAHREIFGEPGLSDTQRLDRAEKAAERQIVELQRQINSGEIFPKRKQAFGLRSDKLDAAKTRLEELKLQRKYARESLQPKPEPHEQFALNYLLRLRQRAAAYNERIAQGDFAKKERPVREKSDDILKAMAEVEQSKQNFYQARYEAARALRSTPRKIWDGIVQTKNAFLNIFSSYDLSAPRQMFPALMAASTRLITSPTAGAKLIAKPLSRMFVALSSEKKSAAMEQRRKSRPNALSGADKAAKVQYTELHTTDFTKGEENARSVLDDWAQLPVRTGNAAKTIATALPKVAAKGVRASNRAFITALNEMRAGLLDHLLSVNFKDRAPTTAELEVTGNLVNVSTGRGKLGRGVAKVAGEVLWSPSLFASRIQMLIGQPLWGGGEWKGSGRARKIVAKEYARWIVSGAALYAASRLFDDDDEADTTSSDVGKIVRGKTRIDPWAGFQQPIVLASRLAQGETTSIDGKTKRLTPYDTGAVIWNFFKNKTRPDIVAIVKVAIAAVDSGKTGKDVRVTPAEAATAALPFPLALQEIIAVMRENGMAEGAIIQAFSEFGVGVSVYEEREKQR